MNLNPLSLPGISELENRFIMKAIRRRHPSANAIRDRRKILYVIKHIEECGGVETRLLQYADLLARHGYDVAFVTETNRFAPLDRFSCYHLNFHARNFEKSLTELIARLGIGTVEWQIKTRKCLDAVNPDRIKSYCRMGCCIHGSIRGIDLEKLNRADYRILISNSLFHIDYAQLHPYKVLPIAIAEHAPQWHYDKQRTALLISRIGRDKYDQITAFVVYCQTRGIPFRIAGPLISRSTTKRLKRRFDLNDSHFIGKLADTRAYLSEHLDEYLFVAGVGQVLLEAGSLGYPCYLTSDLGAGNSTFITRSNIRDNFGCNLTLAYEMKERISDLLTDKLPKYDISEAIKERFNLLERYAEYERYVFGHAD